MRGKLFELKSIVEAVAMDESRLAVTWEADILHHIISFFICPNLCLVDGEALRSCSLVSRRWKQIVYSPAIWAFLAGGEESRKDEACAVSMSLQIRETVQASVPRSPRESIPSMIGFLNLGRVQRRSTENTSTWLVLHRATMRRYVISVPKDEEKTNEMIRELFEAHHVQEERFLRATSNSNIIRRFRCFPRGVYIRDGRLIRWYDDEPYSIYSGDIIQQKGNQECNRLNSDLHLLPTNENQDLDNSISHLLSLEGATSPIDISRNHARMDCWATLVDWIIEIVECFNLEDRIAFRAMSFFDRFISKSKRRVKSSAYQVVASACFCIAAKCYSQRIGSSDISFCADNSFDGRELTSVENAILCQLDWKLAFPVVLDFVLAYVKVLGIYENNQLVWMMRYVSELSLLSPVYLSYLPSMIGASVVVLSSYCLGLEADPWPLSLEEATGYSWNDLEACTVALCRHLEDVRSTMPDLIMIARRYRKQERANVAEIAIPPIRSFATLTAYRQSHTT